MIGIAVKPSDRELMAKPRKRSAPMRRTVKQRKPGPDDVDPREYLRDLENLPETERNKIKYGSEKPPDQPGR